jgi:hypothetical protein
MIPERWHRAKVLFAQALELEVAERSEFILKAC